MSRQKIPTIEMLRNLLEYDPDTGKLTWRARPVEAFRNHDKRNCKIWNARYAGKEAFTYLTVDGYKKGKVNGTNTTAHRVSWAIHYGEWPKSQIDHINGDRSDNRISNLRDVTASVNARNRALYSSNKSGYPGVHFCNGKWISRIYGKNDKHLGTFSCFGLAIKARLDAERELGFHENHGRR